jgi:hypothetical protein
MTPQKKRFALYKIKEDFMCYFGGNMPSNSFIK